MRLRVWMLASVGCNALQELWLVMPVRMVHASLMPLLMSHQKPFWTSIRTLAAIFSSHSMICLHGLAPISLLQDLHVLLIQYRDGCGRSAITEEIW